MKWWLKIERIQNGYVCTENGDDGVDQVVIEDREDDPLASHQSLLFHIMDFFAFGGSKHDKERIRVTRETRDAS